MKVTLRVIGAVMFLSSPPSMFCATELTVPDVTVGRNLQVNVSIRLPQAAPDEGLQVTVTSDDPKSALISRSPDRAGSPSISSTVMRRNIYIPGFFIQGVGDSGFVTYTVTVSGMGTAKGKITLVPSTIAMIGPSKQSSFKTTPRGLAYHIKLVSATLDSSMKVAEEQLVAGGSKLTIPIRNSNPTAGAPSSSSVIIVGGESMVQIGFTPAREGESVLTLDMPAGLHAPADYSSVTVTVERPGLSVADDLTIGKDLQMPGIVCLGDSAGPDGLEVTLTSTDPGKLLLSDALDKMGKASITLKVAPGGATASYYMQSFSDSGKVSYQATANGYRSREGHVAFAPSGLIVGYAVYGPPDEAAVLRQIGEQEDRRFSVSLAESTKKPPMLMVWSAYLSNGLAADITVQQLRPGVTVTANLASSNKAVATVDSPVTIKSGSNRAPSKFTPLTVGESVITIDTPAGFSKPKNAVQVPASVVN